MLRGCLVASFSVASLAIYCHVNAGATACEFPNASTCVSLCYLYNNKNSCATIAGCNWTTHSCEPVDESLYCEYSFDEATCTANNMCRWQTTECKFMRYCHRTNQNSTCYSIDSMTTADCTNQAGCAMQADCLPANRCEMIENQYSCTGSAGCFWSTGSTSVAGITANSSTCSPCFNDPSNTGNAYKTFLSHVGQTCTLSLTDPNTTIKAATVKYYSAIAAASGCTGGSLVVDRLEDIRKMICTNNTANNNNNKNNNNKNSNNNNNTTKIAVGVACGVVALLCLIVCAAYALKRRRDRQREEEAKLPEEKVSLHPLHGLVSEDNPEKQHD